MIIILQYFLILLVFQIQTFLPNNVFDILCLHFQDPEHRSGTSGQNSKRRPSNRVKNKPEGKSFLYFSALNNVTRKQDEYVNDYHITIFFNVACLQIHTFLPIHFFLYLLLSFSRKLLISNNESLNSQLYCLCLVVLTISLMQL